MKKVVDTSYASSASKTAAIVKGIFGAEAEEKMKGELRHAKHISLSFDTSTFHGMKIFPIIASYFDQRNGLQHRLIALIDMKTAENAESVSWVIEEVAKLYSIEKVTAICADNCPLNYGSFDRHGSNNVFAHLTKTYFIFLLLECIQT